jgi:hypothetical protein
MQIETQQCGWASTVSKFRTSSIDELINYLSAFIKTSTPEQFLAWKRSLPPLQKQCDQLTSRMSKADKYGAILEYSLPESSKRADVVLLVSGAVLVLELKGDGNENTAYLEQAADYSRRLYWYHKHCAEEKVRVHTLVVSYGKKGASISRDFITLVNIQDLSEIIERFDKPPPAKPIELEDFIKADACQPSLSLVRAVREYYSRNSLPRIKRIDEITGKALRCIVDHIHDAHRKKTRKLILLSGVPGAGKTFVGMQIAHDSFLDDLVEPSSNGQKPTAPAVFLSGNRPLVEVLQYEMRQAGGEGAVFVRHVHEFIKRFSRHGSISPPHHVMIFDEAQRAWDANQVRRSHGDPSACSEPEAFIRFAEKVPGWSVVIGLLGDGQQISYGEEGGVSLWADAVAKGCPDWEVCGPEHFKKYFESARNQFIAASELYLSKSVRFHFAAGLSEWATGVVDGLSPENKLLPIAEKIRNEGYQLRVTRNLAMAKRYLWDKYRDDPDARFGLMVSARDKASSKAEGVMCARTKFFRAGPWYSDPEASPSSCRRLVEAITEFSAQGLELDHGLFIWGNDFMLKGGKWTDELAMRFQRKAEIKNPLQLRKNAYRVLLTRGREGLIICLPKTIKELDETHEYLLMSGCEDMDTT